MSFLAAAAKATIQFIGIIVMSHQGPTLQAIIPKIPPPQTSAAVGIEPHTAFIAFPKSAVLYNGWGTAPTDLTNGYAYLLLDHDEIIFDTLGVKNEPIFTSKNKRLPVPTLTFSGTQPVSWNQPYQMPSNAGTAAVVDIPEGALGPCHAKVTNIDGVLTRTDTKVELNTNGVIGIRTVDGSKVLMLVANDHIYINNVPMNWALTHGIDPHFPLHHWQMYYLMTTQPNGTKAPQDPPGRIPDCAESPSLPPPRPGGGRTSTTLSQLRMSAMPMASAATIPPSDSSNSSNSDSGLIVGVNTAECSNTQWP